MTTQINLLPWRAELRQEQKKQFIGMIVLTLLLSGAAAALIHIQVAEKISYQISRNEFVKSEISTLDEQIAEIRDLQKTRRRLLERMDVIQALQTSRPSIVHLFTEIVGTVPNGVYLDSLLQTGTSLVMNGQAESNARVSAYMRNLINSEWLRDPNLSFIEIEDKKVNRISTFALTVEQTSPNANQNERNQANDGSEGLQE